MIKEDLKELITKKEFDLLIAFGFDINIDIPYTYFPLLTRYLKTHYWLKDYVISEIFDLLNEYIQNAMLFPIYLYYSSYEIFFGSIYLIKQKKPIFNFLNLKELIQIAKIEIDVDKIYQCSKCISKINKVKEMLQSKETNNTNVHTSENPPNDNSQNNINFDIIRSIKVIEI